MGGTFALLRTPFPFKAAQDRFQDGLRLKAGPRQRSDVGIWEDRNSPDMAFKFQIFGKLNVTTSAVGWI